MIALPVFPLSVVVFPDETMELHIFETRYRQLIHECDENGITFGIIANVENKIAIYGTEVVLKKIKHYHDDGRIDILVQGKRAFKLHEFYHKYPNRLYPGARISYLDNVQSQEKEVFSELGAFYERIIGLLGGGYEPSLSNTENLSFQIAHQVGLNIKQKIKLLSLEKENERQDVILEYFNQVLPILESVVEEKN